MKKTLFVIGTGILLVMAGSAYAAPPSGLASLSITLNAVVSVACQEAQQGAFPSPLVIDTQSASDQTFAATADEKIVCTNGTAFAIRVTSANGTAVNQPCTSSGVSSMALKSASFPSDTIAYTFFCAGDTDGLGNFTGAGFSVPKAVGMSVKIAAADAQMAKAHADYSDTVTMTLSY